MWAEKTIGQLSSLLLGPTGFKGGKGGVATFSPFKSLEAHVGGGIEAGNSLRRIS